MSSQIEFHLLLATFKNRLTFNLQLHEESHEKGLPEDADVRASEGVLYPLEVFLLFFKTISQHSYNTKKEGIITDLSFV